MPSTRPGVPPTTPLSPRRIPAWIGATLTAVVAAGTLLPGAAFAGRLHPALQEELSSLSLNDQATAIIVLKDQVDLDALQASRR